MNGIKCFFCLDDVKKKYSIKSFKKPFDIFECQKCHLMFQYPIPSKKSLEEMYQEGYYTGQNKDFIYEDERKTYKYNSYVWKKRIKKLLKYMINKNEKKILDIGCSFGGLLKNALSFGFDCYGIEISDYSRKYALEIFKNKIYKNFNEAGFKDNFFDCITMIEVIEHVEDPVYYLKELYRVLKKDGILLLQTANMEGKQAKKEGEKYHYFLPGHLFYFSKSNLREKLMNIGFKKIKFFHPVEFGLLPKLLKSRGSFKSIKDYFKWITICYYHLKSKIYYKDFSLTSSMVIYAWK